MRKPIDGTTPTYGNWNTGQPSTLNASSDCAAIRQADGKWQMELCSGFGLPEGFICEIPP